MDNIERRMFIVDDKIKIANVAQIMHEVTAVNREIVDSWTKRPETGLSIMERLLAIESGLISSIKFLHVLLQLKVEEGKRISFSAFLRNLADTEWTVEMSEKGGGDGNQRPGSSS